MNHGYTYLKIARLSANEKIFYTEGKQNHCHFASYFKTDLLAQGHDKLSLFSIQFVLSEQVIQYPFTVPCFRICLFVYVRHVMLS